MLSVESPVRQGPAHDGPCQNSGLHRFEWTHTKADGTDFVGRGHPLLKMRPIDLSQHKPREILCSSD